jgi:hypothetical protein
VACVALFLLLPMSKIAQHGDRMEPLPKLADPPAESTQPVAVPVETRFEAVQPATIEPAPATDIEATVAVSGRVGNAYGAPVADVEIELESKGFDGEEIVRTRVLSDRLGNFILQMVPSRQYLLSIQAHGDYAGYRLEAFTDSSALPLQNIILERLELVDIDGMIVDTNLAPIADFALRLRHLTVDFPDRDIRSDSSGYFSVRGFPAGEWRIASDTSDYYRIKGLEIQPGEYRNLTLMIDRGNYYLSGWVSDANGIPLPGVFITLKSAFATDEYHSFSYRSVESDDNGAFEFADLGGHQVTLGVYRPGFRTLIRKHDFGSYSDNIDIVIDRE